MESLLFTDQCVYLSRKHLLWNRKGFFICLVALEVSRAETCGEKGPDRTSFNWYNKSLLKLDVMETWFRFQLKLTLLKLLKSAVLSREHTSSPVNQVHHKKGPPPPSFPDPEALILNGTLVPSPQEFIN